MSDEQPNVTPAESAADTVVTGETPNTLLTESSTGGTPTADTSNVGNSTTEGNTDATASGNTDEGIQAPPDTYADFTAPEGVELDVAALESATPLFKELGLTQEQAQKLVDFHAAQVQASSQSQVEAHNQLMKEWQDQSINDKEFGGDKFEENVKLARSAIKKFGTPGLNDLLSAHGVGNHPEVIRFMVKVGKLTAEDVPGANGQLPAPAKNRVDILYPSSTENA